MQNVIYRILKATAISSKYVRSGIYVSLAVNMSDQAYMCH